MELYRVLIGLSRATFDDDDGGFSGNRSHDRNSPGDEMLTLEQFLMEVDKSPGNKTSEKQEDTESKSSENSDNSANRRLHQQKRHAPPPPGSHNNFTQQPNRRPTSSIPDVAAVSGLHSDLNVSRMSRISTGSSGSGSYEQATPPKREHPETSTPAQPSNNSQFKKRSYEDLNSFSPFVKYQNEQPHDFRKNTLGSTPSSASRTLQYSYATSPHNDTSHSIGPKSPQNRELPPTPVDKERDNPNLNPAERLDRLMMGFSNSPHNNSNSSSPRVNSNMNNSINSTDRDSSNYDMSVRSGPTSQHYDPSIRSNQQHPVRNMNSESPSDQRPSYPVYGRPHSSLGHPKVQQLSPSHNGPSGLPPSGSNERSFTSARLGPRPYSNVNNTTRPVSAAYDSNSLPQQGYSSSDNRNSMDRVRQSPNNVQHNGPVRNQQDGGHSARVQRIERPKSVPPNMFNPPPEHLEQQTNSNYSQPYHHGGANPPVAPPRKMRDAPVTNRISLIRQPGQQQTPANRPMTSGSPQGNYHSTGGSGGGRQLPQGGLTRSQTPTGRIGALVKPVQNTPPAPKPMNEEPKDPKDPKDNSVWNARW